MSTYEQGAATSGSNGAGDSTSELLERGRKLLEAGRVRESERVFEEAIAAGGHASQLHYLGGVARLKLSDLEGAAARFERALEVDPSNADALYGLGVVAEGRGAYESAVGLYEQAVAVDGQHAAALRKLREYRTETELARRWGVYAYIVGDKAPLARKGVRLMEMLRRSGRPRLVAYLGRYIVHFLVLGVALGVIAAAGEQAEAETGVSLPWPTIAAVIGLSVLAIFCLRVLTTQIELDKGRLQVERGILNKRRTSVELWRVRDLELRRPLLNRLTGDCTLVLRLNSSGAARGTARMPRPGGGCIRITGLLHGRRLRENYEDLLNLIFALRSNAQVKGIIQ
jgi:membrane protein YdbS with pleckstrin-like domain